MNKKLTDDELAMIRRALCDAIYSAQRGDNLGPLAEYGPSKRGTQWVEYDEQAAQRNADVARSALAKLIADYWGVAEIDQGIVAAATTRKGAVAKIGFATPYTRSRQGRLYHYLSAEGSGATVGRVRDLIAAGFELLPNPEVGPSAAVR